MTTIAAVLNGYKRANLPAQIAALREQSVPPDEVLAWHNAPSVAYSDSDVCSAACNRNLGVWARFAFALNTRCEYVCVFDDDTIPGANWFQNCLETMSRREALLGTVGILYDGPTDTYYGPLRRVGWTSANAAATEVDFVGHAWFFKRAWLSTFWRELPELAHSPLCGEDMHFSWMLQRYLGVPTIVPPHPANDRRLWGSIDGDRLGKDEHSLWESNPGNFRGEMDRFFATQRRQGWRLVNDVRQ